MLDPAMKAWFEKVNPWALEEIGRRLLEAETRGIWKPDPALLERLKDAYLGAEACIEDTMGEVQGNFQGGAVDMITADEVAGWKSAMQVVKEKMKLP